VTQNTNPVMQTLARRVTELEARLADVEPKHGLAVLGQRLALEAVITAERRCAELERQLADTGGNAARGQLERRVSELLSRGSVLAVLEHFASPEGDRRALGGEQFPNRECCSSAWFAVRDVLELVNANPPPAKETSACR